MPPTRGRGVTGLALRIRGVRWRACPTLILALTVIVPLILFSWYSITSVAGFPNTTDFGNVPNPTEKMERRFSALEHKTNPFPKEILDALYSEIKDSHCLTDIGQKDLSSSLVQEEKLNVSGKPSDELLKKSVVHDHDRASDDLPKITSEEARAPPEGTRGPPRNGLQGGDNLHPRKAATSRQSRKQSMHHRHGKRPTEPIRHAKVEAEAIQKSKDLKTAANEKFSISKREDPDSTAMIKKLRTMVQSSEKNAKTVKKHTTFLSQLAAKTIPKGLHCLALLLTVEYNVRPLDEQDFPTSSKLEDPSLYHYALFSDNILAAGVVINSTVLNAKEPEKHVFHLITDKMNYGGMKMWFLENPPGKATIQVENVDNLKWLNTTYCPVLHQLGLESMKEYYFKSGNGGSFSNQYRNPKYLSMLNHLRFYLPEMFPKLDKIIFLDDDVVVQKDLSELWSLDLQGNVNGAVETCGPSFHRFDKYLNFSNPVIANNFDPKACGWAYGMNIFDLVEWKKRNLTGIYHKWQRLNEDRVLWKLGTLPPGLITFYNLTYPLDKGWHVLGLGYNAGVLQHDIERAAVVHYNGNMKPWLEIGMSWYKPYWTKYVKYDHPFLQQCNINN